MSTVRKHDQGGAGVATTVEVNGVTLGIEQFGDPADPLVLLVGGTTMLSWPDALCVAPGRVDPDLPDHDAPTMKRLFAALARAPARDRDPDTGRARPPRPVLPGRQTARRWPARSPVPGCSCSNRRRRSPPRPPTSSPAR